MLGIAPVAFLPGLNGRWGWPVLLCAAGAATASIWAPRTGRLPRGVVITVGVLLATLVLTALCGAAPLPQLLGRAPRYEGVIEWVALTAAAAVAARVLGPSATAGPRRHAVAALATSSLLLAAIALLEAVGLSPIESDLLRPGSLAGNATDQGILGAVYVAVPGALAVGRWRRGERPEAWVVAAAVAGVVAVATSASRAGLVALCIVVIALIAYALIGSTRRRRIVFIVSGGLALLAAAMLLVPLTRNRVLGLSAFARQTVEDRLIMWGDAWSLFLSSPVLGVGPNGFADAITTRFDDGWFDRAGVGAILDSPHNAIVQSFVVGGLVATVPAVVLGVVVAIATARSIRVATGRRRDAMTGATVAVIAAGVALLTHVTSPKTLVLLAALVGYLVAVAPASTSASSSVGAGRGARAAGSSRGAEVSRSGRRRVWASILAGIWLIALVTMTIADAWLLAGRAAIAKGQLPAASHAFSAAAALRPWDPDVSLVAAETYGSAVQNGLVGALDDARTWAERAVESLPMSSRAQYVAGIAATLAGDVAVAFAHLRRAAQLSPADPRIQHEYGVSAFFAGDPRTARIALERAVALAPETSATWAVLAEVCEELGDSPCAQHASRRVEEIRSTSSDG